MTDPERSITPPEPDAESNVLDGDELEAAGAEASDGQPTEDAGEDDAATSPEAPE